MMAAAARAESGATSEHFRVAIGDLLAAGRQDQVASGSRRGLRKPVRPSTIPRLAGLGV